MFESIFMRTYPPAIEEIKWKVIDFLVRRNVLAVARCRAARREKR